MEIKKILAYDVYENTEGTARYEHVCALLQQTIDPPSLFSNTLSCKNQDVLISSQNRAVSCLDSATAKSITTTSALNEIPFSLAQYCTERMYTKKGSTVVRKAFVEAFMDDQLAIPHKQLREELQFLMSVSKTPNPPLCISHTFRMKLIEIYTSIGEVLFQQPAEIQKHVDCSRHLFDFGEVLEV